MHTRTGLLLRLAAAGALAGCRNATPPVEEFLIAPLTALEPALAEQPSASDLAAVRVEPLSARGFLARREICWREGDVRAGPYHYRRWGELPDATVTRALIDRLRARGRFARVDGGAAGERVAPPVRVAGELLALHEECDAQGRSPHGVAALELVVEVQRDGMVVRSVVASARRVPAADDSMEALVRAIGDALGAVLDEVVPQVEALAAQARS